MTTTQVQHTPGPWTAGFDDGEWWVGKAEGWRSFTIARSMREADARLIAAAPDLLAALEIVAHEFEFQDGPVWLDNVRDVIAQARENPQ